MLEISHLSQMDKVSETSMTGPTTLFFLLDLREPSKWIPSLWANSEGAVYLIGFASYNCRHINILIWAEK